MGHKGKIFVTFATTIQKTIGPKKFCDNVPIISFITASRSADCIQQGNWLPRLSISHFVLLFIRFTDNCCFRIVKLSESFERSLEFVWFKFLVIFIVYTHKSLSCLWLRNWGYSLWPAQPSHATPTQNNFSHYKATFRNRLLILIPEIKTLVIASNHRPRVIFVDALCVFAASEELSPLLTSCHWVAVSVQCSLNLLV